MQPTLGSFAVPSGFGHLLVLPMQLECTSCPQMCFSRCSLAFLPVSLLNLRGGFLAPFPFDGCVPGRLCIGFSCFLGALGLLAVVPAVDFPGHGVVTRMTRSCACAGSGWLCVGAGAGAATGCEIPSSSVASLAPSEAAPATVAAGCTFFATGNSLEAALMRISAQLPFDATFWAPFLKYSWPAFWCSAPLYFSPPSL